MPNFLISPDPANSVSNPIPPPNPSNLTHRDAASLILSTLKDPTVKFELLDLVRLTLIEPEIKGSLGSLFAEVFAQSEVQNGMKKL